MRKPKVTFNADAPIMVERRSIRSTSEDRPRTTYDAESIALLAQDIAERGLLQNLVVTREGNGFVLISGERRLRALDLLIEASKLPVDFQVPCVVVNVTGVQAFIYALAENLQRESMTPIEEANAFKTLMDKHGYNTAQIADLIHRTRRYVQYRLQFLKLPPETAQEVERGTTTIAEARSMVAQPRYEANETGTYTLAAERALDGSYIVTVRNPHGVLHDRFPVAAADMRQLTNAMLAAA